MVRKLEGSFKGLRFIGSLKESLRGGKKKASWSDTDTSELIRFSKVGTRCQEMFNAVASSGIVVSAANIYENVDRCMNIHSRSVLY